MPDQIGKTRVKALGEGKLPAAKKRTMKALSFRYRLSKLLLRIGVGLDSAPHVFFQLIEGGAGCEAARQLSNLCPVTSYVRIFFFMHDDRLRLQRGMPSGETTRRPEAEALQLR